MTPRIGRPCGIAGCEKGQHARGYCQTHYQKLRRHGDLAPVRVHLGEQAKPQGVACQVCGRSVMEHGVTEFCELIERRMTA